MEHDQTLTLADLQREAAATFASSPWSAADLAAALRAEHSAITHALEHTGSRFAALQVRIIEMLNPGVVLEDVTEPVFRVRKVEPAPLRRTSTTPPSSRRRRA